ncbi:MAG: GNAT family N-acetyltransferase [Methanoregula sp.]|uniref:GNAT family N-acetyltransferase n=1 Tax=Methanoregula sp. TaxID=2052170 RepID=UPI003BB14A3E
MQTLISGCWESYNIISGTMRYRTGSATKTSAPSPKTQPELSGEDATLLTLYALAGEECGELITLHPHLFRFIRQHLLALGHTALTHPASHDVEVRELSIHEMNRAEEELWIHDNRQKADTETDRLFAAFSGTQLVGVARCSRHPDWYEVDSVYVLEEYRHQGFARLVMKRLIEECGRHETLHLHAKPELVDFYREMGFVPVQSPEIPETIRPESDAYGSVENSTCSMKRDPSPGS